jgi:hypothetical protein
MQQTLTSKQLKKKQARDASKQSKKLRLDDGLYDPRDGSYWAETATIGLTKGAPSSPVIFQQLDGSYDMSPSAKAVRAKSSIHPTGHYFSDLMGDPGSTSDTVGDSSEGDGEGGFDLDRDGED